MKNLLQLLLPLYARRRAGLALALLCAVLTVAAGVGLLGISGWFLTGAALAGATGMFNLFAPSALVRGFSMVRIVSRYADRLTGHAATLHLLADLRATVFRVLIRLTPRQLARWRNGDLVARMTSDVDALDMVFLLVLAPLLTALLAGLTLTLVFAVWTPEAAWVLAAGLLLVCVAVPGWLVLAGRKPGAAVQQQAADLRSAVLDAVDGHADLVLLQAAAQAQADFDALCVAAGQARQAQARIAAQGQWLLLTVAGLCTVAVLWFGLDALEQGRIGGPLLVGLLLAAIGVFEVAGPIMRGAARMGAALAGAARVGAIVQAEPDMHDPPQARDLPVRGALELQDVSFTYPGAAAPVLRDINLSVAAGERIAILGASGAGKSTLLHLLLRLDDPQHGRLVFGGCDLRACAQAQLHQRIVLLTQDAPVFLGTLRSNLLIGDPMADDAALWRVLDAVRLGEFVRSLPDGLDTWTGETGASLSVGQARRLCLARALLSPASVLVLDEPTSGLDSQTQSAFFTDLAQAAAGRSVILATHAALSPGTVQRCCYLSGGRLRELAEGPRGKAGLSM